MSKKIASLLISIILLATIVLGIISSQLTFNFDYENFFPQNDKDLAYFLEHRAIYENDNDYTLIAIGNNKTVFNQEFLNKASSFTKELKKLNHVIKVISPTTTKQTIINDFGFIEIPLIHINDTSRYDIDKKRIKKSKEYYQTLFSKDLKSLCIIVNNTQEITKIASDELLNNIESLIKKYDFETVHYAGRIRGQKIYLEKMEKELILFLGVSIALVIILLIISFRSFFGVSTPIIAVLFSIIWTLGIMQLLGKQIDVMTTLLPTILFVVGISDAVHILNKYIEELRNKKEKLLAIKIAFKEIGLATLLTSVTTAVGFITLIMVNIKPVQEFGIYTAIGVIVAFVVTILFLPALLSIIKKPKIDTIDSHQVFWRNLLAKAYIFTLRNPIKIIACYIGIICISIIGITQLKIDYYLLEDLAEDNPLQQDFRFFENQFEGIRPFEMSISVKDTTNSIFDYKIMQEMNKVETYLENEYGAGFIYSPVSLIKLMNKASHSGSNGYYSIPKNEYSYQKLVRKLNHPSLKKSLKNIVRDNHFSCRFTGKMDDVGSKKAKELNSNFNTFFNTQINTELINYKMTGTALLVDKNNEFLAINMITGLFIAFFLISIIMGVLFKSIKMAFISLVPNMIPLIIIGGMMGFFKHSINMSTSIIFTIAFGIAVDDTIHFLSKFKIEEKKKLSFLYILKRTYLSTGKAISLTTLILCGGFITLIFSDFKSTYLIGLYVSSTLLIAVITDLILLPILLRLYMKKKL